MLQAMHKQKNEFKKSNKHSFSYMYMKSFPVGETFQFSFCIFYIFLNYFSAKIFFSFIFFSIVWLCSGQVLGGRGGEKKTAENTGTAKLYLRIFENLCFIDKTKKIN